MFALLVNDIGRHLGNSFERLQHNNHLKQKALTCLKLAGTGRLYMHHGNSLEFSNAYAVNL